MESGQQFEIDGYALDEDDVARLGRDLIARVPHTMCAAEDSDVDYDDLWVPRCVDHLQNLNLFKTRVERNCSEETLCRVAHENTLRYGPRILDLYSIILKRKEGETVCLKGKLKGVIEIQDYPEFRWDINAELSGEGDDKDRCTITLDGPNSTRLFSCDGYSRVAFALTLDDQPLFQGEYPDDYFVEIDEVFGPGKQVSRGFFVIEPRWLAVPYLNNRLIDIRLDTSEKRYVRRLPNVSPVQIFARFAVMQPGLVASIKIKVENHRHITTISGSIYARPCCFTHRIPLINSLENTEVAEDGTIALKRSFVAVPSHASLIIVADGLHDQLGNRVTLCANTFFIPAKEAPSEARIMSEKPGSESTILNGRLQAEVEWIPHKFAFEVPFSTEPCIL